MCIDIFFLLYWSCCDSFKILIKVVAIKIRFSQKIMNILHNTRIDHFKTDVFPDSTIKLSVTRECNILGFGFYLCSKDN